MSTNNQEQTSPAKLNVTLKSLGTLWNELKQLPKEVIAIDSALTELSQSSNATASQLEQCFQDSADAAKELGLRVDDVIKSTAAWSRKGYSLPDSQELARAAALFQNVGDGITLDAATDTLSFALQTFQLNAKDAINVVDQLNEVTKTLPVDSAGLSSALQQSAASFAAANTDLSKSLALLAGTGSLVQDSAAVGAMWETVADNIRNAGTGLDRLIEDTTGFQITDQQDSLKDVYDIVVGIGKAWQDLSRTEQASLLDGLAGNGQEDLLASAFQNVGRIEDAYDAVTNSAGSAMKEQEKYEQSVQYSLDRLSASFQEFSASVLDSSFLKGIVDLGNGALNVLNQFIEKFGILSTLGIGLSAGLGLKNVGRGLMILAPSLVSICRQYKVLLMAKIRKFSYTVYEIHKCK